MPLITPPKNIVVKMPNWLGDVVMATPVLALLRQHFPDAKITAMCQHNVAPLLKNDPHVNEIYSYKKPRGLYRHFHKHEIIETLEKGEYDLGILLTNSFSSAFWFWRGKVQKRIGYANNWRSLLLTEAVPEPLHIEKQHLVATYQMLLEPLGITPVKNNSVSLSPKVYVTPEELTEAKDFLSTISTDWQRHLLIGINPGAAYGSAKCWLPERFEEVTRHLLNNPALFIIYFADAPGSSLVNDICKNFPQRVINLAGKTTLRELMAFISLCSIFLTNDSGPMHIADALKTPLIALFGSTSDVKTGPFHFPQNVIHKHVACSPCYKRECPIDFKCMKNISVEEVYQELNTLLFSQEEKR